ncbi:hypothetical protein D9603_21545 [Pseudoalteromonas sp. PS5]|nr:hypothetical protein D9603_21545 [Pseudoalteromonas sp. PS5]
MRREGKNFYLVVLNKKFLTQLVSGLLLQIEFVLRLIGIMLLNMEMVVPVLHSTAYHLSVECRQFFDRYSQKYDHI